MNVYITGGGNLYQSRTFGQDKEKKIIHYFESGLHHSMSGILNEDSFWHQTDVRFHVVLYLISLIYLLPRNINRE